MRSAPISTLPACAVIVVPSERRIRLRAMIRQQIRTIPIVLALLDHAAWSMTGGSVDAKFRGNWVPVKATCDSTLKLTIGPNSLSFVNGSQRAEYRQLEQCFSCAAGGMSNAPQPVWLTTSAMGDSPFTITLDGTRHPPAVSVDFSNDAKLGARFPLGGVGLRKCP